MCCRRNKKKGHLAAALSAFHSYISCVCSGNWSSNSQMARSLVMLMKPRLPLRDLFVSSTWNSSTKSLIDPDRGQQTPSARAWQEVRFVSKQTNQLELLYLRYQQCILLHADSALLWLLVKTDVTFLLWCVFIRWWHHAWARFITDVWVLGHMLANIGCYQTAVLKWKKTEILNQLKYLQDSC